MSKKHGDGLIGDQDLAEVTKALQALQANSSYLTKPNYRGTSERWTNNYTSFVDYHLNYLRLHPQLNPQQYIANLRLKLKKRPASGAKE